MITSSTRREASSRGCSKNRPSAVDLRVGGDRVALCEVLDRVLNKGVVVAGDIVISVAGVDLIYLGLHVVLTSVETANRSRAAAPRAAVVQEA